MVINVAGVNVAYFNNVKSLYDKAVNDPSWVPDIKLVPEPENQYDPKAVAVVIDGLKIGYAAKAHQPDLSEFRPEVFVNESTACLYKWGKCGPDNDKFFVQVEI